MMAGDHAPGSSSERHVVASSSKAPKRTASPLPARSKYAKRERGDERTAQEEAASLLQSLGQRPSDLLDRLDELKKTGKFVVHPVVAQLGVCVVGTDLTTQDQCVIAGYLNLSGPAGLYHHVCKNSELSVELDALVNGIQVRNEAHTAHSAVNPLTLTSRTTSASTRTVVVAAAARPQRSS
jgi:hypothetical protein